MTRMIERVALAAASAYFGRPVTVEYLRMPCTGGESWMLVARAAIEALSNPPVEIVDAALWTHQMQNDRALHRGTALAAWNDMITAALNQTSPNSQPTEGEG